MPTKAEKQFNTSSRFHAPEGYDAWLIRNDYPSKADSDATWHDVDPAKHPKAYLEILKTYCLKGMIDADFVPQKNKERQWYHAPWMHESKTGREPLRGLTSERELPPRELSESQGRYTQTWAVGFFNELGATILEKMWHDPNDPEWKANKKFPNDTVIYKLLFCNNTDKELPVLKGAPQWQAMIAVQPEDPSQVPDPNVRLTHAPNEVRLIQMDIGVRDDRATATGWVWGTFMYVCNSKHKSTGFDGLIPIGLSWGNDPEFNQAAYESQSSQLQSTWINPDVNEVLKELKGSRPFWGWNGRLNGPADGFISACQSCHSTAQWNPHTQSQDVSTVPPTPLATATGGYVPANDEVTMSWFGNVKCGETIDPKRPAFSADYSLQLMIGYENYVYWREKNEWEEGGKQGPEPIDKRPIHRRQGPTFEF